MADAAAGAIPRSAGDAFSYAWKPVGGALKWAVIGVLVVAGFAALILLSIFLWNVKSYGGASAAMTQLTVSLDNSGLSPVATLLRRAFVRGVSGDVFFDEPAARSDIDQSQRDPPEVKIASSSIQIVNQPVFYGQQVSVVGSLSVKNPPADLEIRGSCAMDEIVVDAPISGPEGVARVVKGSSPLLSMTCTLPGVEPPSTSTVFTPGGESFSKKVVAPSLKQVEMRAAFTYATKALLPTYVYNRQDVESFLRAQQSGAAARSLFAARGINDPQVSKDGTVRSIATQGPVNVGLKTLRNQPLVDGELNVFQVSLLSNTEWAVNNNGQMQRLESLELYVPEFLVLAGDPDFPKALTQVSCDFVFTGERTERGEKIYELNVEKLALTNRQCSEEEVAGSDLTVTECKDLFGVENAQKNYFCSFMLTQPFTELKKAFMEARASYLYEVRGSKAVKISPQIGVS